MRPRITFTLDGKPKMMWLPQGLTLPWFDTNGETLKINIRRLDWHENDNYGKYIKIAGACLAQRSTVIHH